MAFPQHNPLKKKRKKKLNLTRDDRLTTCLLTVENTEFRNLSLSEVRDQIANAAVNQHQQTFFVAYSLPVRVKASEPNGLILW